MKYFLFVIIFFLNNSNLFCQIKFDYTAIEKLTDYYNKKNTDIESIINHPGYQHIILHSKKYSSNPINENDLRNSLNGKSKAFDFENFNQRKDRYIQIIEYIKKNETQIIKNYGELCLKYLPSDYKQNAVIYFVIGGYNGIAFDDKICINIDNKAFRENTNELNFYIAHELFHIGFEKYHNLPDIFSLKTVKELKQAVELLTMNEGLATLSPYYKRIEQNEISDSDYKSLLDTAVLKSKITQFKSVLKYLDDNIDKQITDEILANILGQCSSDRLFYIVGCYIGLRIEEQFGAGKIRELITLAPNKYIDIINL